MPGHHAHERMAYGVLCRIGPVAWTERNLLPALLALDS